MEGDEFVRKMPSRMPSTAVLEEYGLSAEEILDVQSAFIAQERSVGQAASNNELEALLHRYDCLNLAVATLKFESSLKPHPKGTIFVHYEADPMVITDSGSVRMFDHSQPNTSGDDCAADASRFLDGVAHAAEAIANRSQFVGKRVDIARGVLRFNGRRRKRLAIVEGSSPGGKGTGKSPEW